MKYLGVPVEYTGSVILCGTPYVHAADTVAVPTEYTNAVNAVGLESCTVRVQLMYFNVFAITQVALGCYMGTLACFLCFLVRRIDF